jgi:transcriptional regulator with XRE-family HTH domain
VNIKIGTKIKALRTARGLTQEKLAEYLGVSCQAVSKWELENGYPDIELLPALSSFFGISSDELLGIDITRNKDIISGYVRRYRELSQDSDAQLALMREAAAKFPGSYVILQHLMYALVACMSPHGSFDTSGKSFIYELDGLIALKDDPKYRDGIVTDRKTLEEADNRRLLGEAMSIAERILADCTEDVIRHSAIQVLCFCYPLTGQQDDALALVQSMPPLYISREFLKEEILSGEEKITQLQRNICRLTDTLCCEICAVADPDLQQLNILSLDDKIHLFELANRLYGLVFENGDYGLFHERLAFNYRIMASLTLLEKPAEDTLTHLEQAAVHAIAADTLPAEVFFTSTAVNRLRHDDLTTDADRQTPDYLFHQKNVSNRIVYKIEDIRANQSGLLLRKLEQPRYDSLRETERFKAIIEKLSQFR